MSRALKVCSIFLITCVGMFIDIKLLGAIQPLLIFVGEKFGNTVGFFISLPLFIAITYLVLTSTALINNYIYKPQPFKSLWDSKNRIVTPQTREEWIFLFIPALLGVVLIVTLYILKIV